MNTQARFGCCIHWFIWHVGRVNSELKCWFNVSHQMNDQQTIQLSKFNSWSWNNYQIRLMQQKDSLKCLISCSFTEHAAMTEQPRIFTARNTTTILNSQYLPEYFEWSEYIILLLSNSCHLAWLCFQVWPNRNSSWPALMCISLSINFKNLSICIDDGKGMSGKLYHEPATGIPWN